MILYRAVIRLVYNDYEYNARLVRAKTHFIELNTIRETPCGYWVRFKGKEKWISKTSIKRFAYTTKKDALTSLECRTKRRLFYLKQGIEEIEKWIEWG